MLVKRSIVENWYQRDSWVYRNFAYLFSNPLWDKNVPNGFSVCPYFWLSLISFFLFRPLIVAPIKYLFRPLIGCFGKGVKIADLWIGELFQMIGLIPKGSKTPEGAGALICFCALLISFGIGYLGVGLYKTLVTNYTLLTGSFAGKWSFWWALSYVPIILGLLCHKLATGTRCKTFNYLWVLSTLFFVSSLIVIPGAVLSSVWLVLKLAFMGVAGFFIVIGAFIFALLKWIWGIIVIMVCWNPFTYMPGSIALYLLALTAISAIFSIAIEKFAFAQLENLQRNHPLSYQQKCRLKWCDIFAWIVETDKDMSYTKLFLNNARMQNLSDNWITALLVYKNEILAEAFQIYWSDEFKTWQNKFPDSSDVPWSTLKVSSLGIDSKFAWVFKCLNQGNVKNFNPSEFNIIIANVATQSYLASEIKALFQELVNTQNAKREKRHKKDLTNAHKCCLKVTESIGAIVKTVFLQLKKLGMNICTFIAYLWILVKAKKQGACPYITFKDAPAAVHPVSIDDINNILKK